MLTLQKLPIAAHELEFSAAQCLDAANGPAQLSPEQLAEIARQLELASKTVKSYESLRHQTYGFLTAGEVVMQNPAQTAHGWLVDIARWWETRPYK